jgi:hypothetical protein
MEGARECCGQVRHFLPHEYTEKLLLSVSGWFAWGPKKGRFINRGKYRWRERQNAVLK